MKKLITTLISISLIIYILFPFFWLVISSFKVPEELFQKPPTWFPEKGTIEYYVDIIKSEDFQTALLNSLIVASFSTIISLILGTIAAYAFARLKFRGKNMFFLTILCTQMLPQMALLIPLFVLMRTTGLLYTHTGLIFASVTFSLPYVVWMFRSFIVSVPYDIEEAARLDGCTKLEAIIKMVVPLSLPGFVTTGIFVFIGAWNEFLFASIMSNSDTKTLPVRIAEYIGEERVAYELMFPTGVLATIPVLILVLIFQRYIIQGLTDGSVK